MSPWARDDHYVANWLYALQTQTAATGHKPQPQLIRFEKDPLRAFLLPGKSTP